MPAGYKRRGKQERGEIYATLQKIVGKEFTEKDYDAVRKVLLNYVKSEVLFYIAKSDKDKNEFLRGV